MHIVLFEPEIPPNTGNVARLCAAMRVSLHLIEPLGFRLESKYLKRAGLDYWPNVDLTVWPDFAAYLDGPGKSARIIASSSRKGDAVHHFHFTGEDALLLGPETRGLPENILAKAQHLVRIPVSDKVRSINLSTAAGILLFQALSSCGALDNPVYYPDEQDTQ
ncbi:tRNA (cytidine(34)-2'-O)-methyltransferase [Desulfovibrio sp. OttesenSCG-928-G15]|nr:tRNA (cytidine(34)-2'-O)-methyltransferase [Desulfovibrio sp. OttesenSCG-928-G15]